MSPKTTVEHRGKKKKREGTRMQISKCCLLDWHCRNKVSSLVCNENGEGGKKREK